MILQEKKPGILTSHYVGGLNNIDGVDYDMNSCPASLQVFGTGVRENR